MHHLPSFLQSNQSLLTGFSRNVKNVAIHITATMCWVLFFSVTFYKIAYKPQYLPLFTSFLIFTKRYFDVEFLTIMLSKKDMRNVKQILMTKDLQNNS